MLHFHSFTLFVLALGTITHAHADRAWATRSGKGHHVRAAHLNLRLNSDSSRSGNDKPSNDSSSLESTVSAPSFTRSASVLHSSKTHHTRATTAIHPTTTHVPDTSTTLSPTTTSKAKAVFKAQVHTTAFPTPTAATPSSYLSAHNNARAEHGADPLTWNTTLASAAQDWASTCKFGHSGVAGENVAAGTGAFTEAEAVSLWMDEQKEYDSGNPLPSHFTQVVWKATSQVGCAVATCGDIFSSDKYGPAHYYVCRYASAGNVLGYFGSNVQLA